MMGVSQRLLGRWLGLDRHIQIADVGAALTERPPYQALVEAGSVRLHLFEPDSGAAQHLRESYGPPHSVHEAFIGSGGPAVFYQTNWSCTGSLFPANPTFNGRFSNLDEFMKPVGEIPVPTRTLDHVLSDAGVSLDILKMDVQGAELSILQAAPQVLEDVIFIMAEVLFAPLYKNAPDFSDVHQYLRAHGFMLHTYNSVGKRVLKESEIEGEPYRGFQQFLWSDAIYLPTFERLEMYDSHKLKAGAAMLHAIQSVDFAAHLLDLLDGHDGGDRAQRYRRLIGVGNKVWDDCQGEIAPIT